MPDHVHLLMEVDPQFGIHKTIKFMCGLGKREKSVLCNETSTLMTQLKSDENYLWLREVDSVALQ